MQTLRRSSGAIALAATVVVGLAAAGCAPGAAGGGDSPGVLPGGTATTATGGEPPPPGGLPDYQLGGPYDPADGVTIVGRDRAAEPADGAYSICYVNGFQTQPGERGLWADDLLVRVDGELLIDPEWPDEVLLDTSTAERRDRIVAIVAPWIRGCADDGFDAVEFDNLDSFTRSDGALSADDNLSLARAYVEVAHEAGLAAGQKNAAEFADVLSAEAGFDFAVVEECAAYRECAAYTDVYGSSVVDIEYTDNLPRPWRDVCADAATPASVVLRDRDLVVAGDEAHVARHC